MTLSDAEVTGDIPKKVLDDCHEEVSAIFKDAMQNFSEAKKHGELRPETNIPNVLITITLIMNGFAKIKELKRMIAPLGGYTIDDDYIINAVFDGLLSFQKSSK
jgi:hypothetical protein